MKRIEIAVDGTGYQTWADDAAAEALRTRVLAAARSGRTLTVEIETANGAELVSEGTLVLRLGSASSVAVRIFADDRTGGAMGISH